MKPKQPKISQKKVEFSEIKHGGLLLHKFEMLLRQCTKNKNFLFNPSTDQDPDLNYTGNFLLIYTLG
jgi:hypothetical protein